MKMNKMEEKFEVLLKNLHVAQEQKNIELQIKALINLGTYHYKNEDYSKAKLSFEDALQLNKNIVEVNYHLALISLEEDKYTEAKDYLELELEINPSNKDAQIILDKLKINSNIPFITILLLILNSIVFFLHIQKFHFFKQ